MGNAGRHGLRLVIVVVASLAGATLAVTALEHLAGVTNASAAYLVAVVLAALFAGTAGAIVTAFGSAALYNFLFTEPRFTFVIHDSGVLLSVILLLFVGVVVGQLAALQRQRAETATAREREARAMFAVSRSLATRDSMAAALAEILRVLAEEASLDRAWVGIGPDAVAETVAADTGDGRPGTQPARVRVLQRAPGDQPAHWTLIQRPSAGRLGPDGVDTYRVRIEASGEPLGSLWAVRGRGSGEPDAAQTRLLAATADQLGQAIRHDRASDQERAAEVARQSDALKSALLQSVSHDLRTPLATIRAAAGGLRPETSLSDDDRRASADAIEREVEYLDRLVANLLDLSRIEAGALRARRDVFDLDDLLARALDRLRPRLGERILETDLRASTVDVDAVFVDEAVTNVLDNAVKYTPDGATLRVTARDLDPVRVRLTIEDDGPGVPDELLPRLFEKFYRVPGSSRRSRAGTGIGLAVARGLVEAMGGEVTARRSALGGLAVDLDLPARPLARAMVEDGTADPARAS
jgi:two-component system, OmpR family, sensor histidine kinase KdpD